jgi:three-Cys-motif partner protein
MPEIGPWSEEKHNLVRSYAQIFATSMKRKWKCRVYIDLFASAGRAKIKGSERIVDGSPLIALGIDNPFDRYIFCEVDETSISALGQRVLEDYSDRDVQFVHGDANFCVPKILSLIPQHTRDFNVLAFCFVDPYSIDNLKFETLRKLSARFMNFLVLIPTGMDAQRNAGIYMKPGNHQIDDFIGRSNWRDEWREAEAKGEKFGHFFLKQFCTSMAEIGYKYTTADKSVDI